MSARIALSERVARFVRSCILRVDIRILVAFVSVAGVLSWVMAWQVTAGFFVLALIVAATTAKLVREGRGALTAYGLFILLWTVSQLLLYLFEYPGEFGKALEIAVLLGAKLFTLLGLALAVPLAATPLTLGRTLTWYLGWLVAVENFICRTVLRGKVRPFFTEGVWRAALALCLMMAFFPRSMRAMSNLRRSLMLRAPNLKLHRRRGLLGLAMLRIVSSQTWDMTLAIASRNLYRPEPWEWSPERRVPAGA
ncbi:hypothetical protein LJC26_07535 [Desulfovibrio sp. OttesenSCG-928-O18]|nr:hypothetical protein [Desulfovibrio sp. OttesenSCG-928-O18]